MARPLGDLHREPVTWRKELFRKGVPTAREFPGVCGVTKEPNWWSCLSNNVWRYLPPLKHALSVFGLGTRVAGKQQSSNGIIARSDQFLSLKPVLAGELAKLPKFT